MERRQFARIPTQLQLKFKTLEQLTGMIEAHAADLSLGGMFLRTRAVKPVGTKIEIEIPIPNGEPATISGVVRSIRFEHNEPAGMGIEFIDLRDPALGVVSYLVGKT